MQQCAMGKRKQAVRGNTQNGTSWFDFSDFEIDVVQATMPKQSPPPIRSLLIPL